MLHAVSKIALAAQYLVTGESCALCPNVNSMPGHDERATAARCDLETSQKTRAAGQMCVSPVKWRMFTMFDGVGHVEEVDGCSVTYTAPEIRAPHLPAVIPVCPLSSTPVNTTPLAQYAPSPPSHPVRIDAYGSRCDINSSIKMLIETFLRSTAT